MTTREQHHDVSILCIRGGNCFKTGQGAIGKTYAETLHLFEQAQRVSVPDKRATFLVDLHDPDGNLVDTAMIDGRGFRKLTGERPPTLAEARRFDREYWANARSIAKQQQDGK